ncbi:MAG TPA: hypothetical protein PLD18_06600 [Flavobacterium sp.]|nr:hypothetical protein [Flavobacterium sp.]
MKIYLFGLFFFTLNIAIYAQDLNKFIKSDTIYIFFKVSKDQHHHNTKIKEKNITKERDEYMFNYGNYHLFTFLPSNSISPEEKKVKKSFIKRNKDMIVNYDFLKTYDYKVATEILNKKKKVYLIDYDDIGLFSIKLKEVEVYGYRYPTYE